MISCKSPSVGSDGQIDLHHSRVLTALLPLCCWDYRASWKTAAGTLYFKPGGVVTLGD